MIALTAILIWLPMPMDSITSVYADDWYSPVEILYVDEPSIEKIEQKWRHQNKRILDLQPSECRE